MDEPKPIVTLVHGEGWDASTDTVWRWWSDESGEHVEAERPGLRRMLRQLREGFLRR